MGGVRVDGWCEVPCEVSKIAGLAVRVGCIRQEGF
jgi:hypothetical protein